MAKTNTIRLASLTFVFCHLAFSTVLTSCSFQQEDYFPESASLRITHLNEQLQDRLVAQSDTTQQRYGWLMQYFVAGTDDYNFEGFNIFGRFYQNGMVTLAGNHRFLRNGNANKFTVDTSVYEMLSEEGPVLSFNTWNDILTVLEDPVSPQYAPGSLVSDGEGMNGDHNLVLRSIDEQAILFRGERHGAEVRFVPCNQPWEEYVEAVAKTKADITSSVITSYYVTNSYIESNGKTVERDTMYFAGLNRGFFTYCDRVNDPLISSTASCVFTPTGLRLGHDYELGSNKFREFRMAADSTCLVSEDDSVKLIACWDNYIVNARTAVWNFDQETLSSAQNELLEQIEAEMKKYNKAYSLASVGLGRSSGGNPVKGLVFTFYTNTAKTRTNTAGLAMTMTKPSFGKMKIDTDSDDKMDNNLNAICNKSNAEQLVRQLASSLNGNYEITPNNYFLPTGCVLQAEGSGQGYILK